MRKIKFRGEDVVTGKLTYGNYYRPLSDIPMIEVKAGSLEIKEGSLSQLIEVDRNGKEVYEGDKVCYFKDSSTWTATFADYESIRRGQTILA